MRAIDLDRLLLTQSGRCALLEPVLRAIESDRLLMTQCGRSQHAFANET